MAFETVKLTRAYSGGHSVKYLNELDALVATHRSGTAVRLPVPPRTTLLNFKRCLFSAARTRGYRARFRRFDGDLIGWVETQRIRGHA